MWWTAGMTDRVTIDISDGVADVRLNRPDKLNAIDRGMFAALAEAADTIAADNSVRAVVLSGEGRGFCAGLDFTSFQAMADINEGTAGTEKLVGSDADPAARTPGRITNQAQWAVYGWTVLPVPVIAAVHGPALGGGFQIALGADIRIVAPDAKLSVMEMRWGLIPDMTGVPMLVRLVGLDVAKELTFTNRTVSGTEAHELGLATHVSDTPLEDALALAREIASKNPHAIRHAKELLNAADQRPLAESFYDETKRMMDLIGSANQAEAVKAYFEKRPPVFTDPS
jgi:enoyl-CoA hydratase/carnithine racemase